MVALKSFAHSGVLITASASFSADNMVSSINVMLCCSVDFSIGSAEMLRGRIPLARTTEYTLSADEMNCTWWMINSRKMLRSRYRVIASIWFDFCFPFECLTERSVNLGTKQTDRLLFYKEKKETGKIVSFLNNLSVSSLKEQKFIT